MILLTPIASAVSVVVWVLNKFLSVRNAKRRTKYRCKTCRKRFYTKYEFEEHTHEKIIREPCGTFFVTSSTSTFR